jgi:dTDP-4-amino-4,6-dideoxygalactose transaminase
MTETRGKQMTKDQAAERQQIHFVRPLLPTLEDVADQIQDVLSSGMVTKGKYLADFEKRTAEHLHVEHVVAVSSCTAGLMLLLSTLPPESEVILPSFTFCASAHPVVWNHLVPIFVDCDIDSFNVDPRRVEEAITENTSAILATHVFGNPCDVDALQAIARDHNLKLFFDAAHAFGASYRGQPLASFGDASAISASPTKLITSGEGGVVATDDAETAEHVCVGREYGNPGNYDCIFPGINARMPELSAILGIECLKLLPYSIQRRREIAESYQELLGGTPGVRFQKIHPQGESSYKDFAIVIDEDEFGRSRDELSAELTAQRIPTRNYFDPPIHAQRAYAAYRPTRHPLSVTEEIAANIICLPIHCRLDDAAVAHIAAKIKGQ